MPVGVGQSTGSLPAQPSRAVYWLSVVLSALPVAMMLLSAAMKIAQPPAVVQGMSELGLQLWTLPVLAVLEIGSALIYAVPRTSVLGAILVTGYLGGAIATHLRVGQAALIGPAILALSAWGGLYLREERLRALIPLRALPRG